MAVYNFERLLNSRWTEDGRLEFFRTDGTRVVIRDGFAYDLTTEEYSRLSKLAVLIPGDEVTGTPQVIPDAPQIVSILAQAKAYTDAAVAAVDGGGGGGTGLPSGGSPGQTIINSAPGTGTWANFPVDQSEFDTEVSSRIAADEAHRVDTTNLHGFVDMTKIPVDVHEISPNNWPDRPLTPTGGELPNPVHWQGTTEPPIEDLDVFDGSGAIVFKDRLTKYTVA